jgi:hypothetical protein
MPDAHSRGCGGEDPSGLGSFQRHSGTRGREETEIAFPVSEPPPHTPSNSCAAWFGGRGGRWCARNLLVGSSAELRSRSGREKDVMPARIWTCRPKRGQGWPRRPPARRTKTRRRGPESTEPARVPSFREDLQRGPVPELPPKRGRDEATRVLRAAEMGWRSRRWYCVGAGQGAQSSEQGPTREKLAMSSSEGQVRSSARGIPSLRGCGRPQRSSNLERPQTENFGGEGGGALINTDEARSGAAMIFEPRQRTGDVLW